MVHWRRVWRLLRCDHLAPTPLRGDYEIHLPILSPAGGASSAQRHGANARPSGRSPGSGRPRTSSCDRLGAMPIHGRRRNLCQHRCLRPIQFESHSRRDAGPVLPAGWSSDAAKTHVLWSRLSLFLCGQRTPCRDRRADRLRDRSGARGQGQSGSAPGGGAEGVPARRIHRKRAGRSHWRRCAFVSRPEPAPATSRARQKTLRRRPSRGADEACRHLRQLARVGADALVRPAGRSPACDCVNR
jgi:hypothetical protein